MTNEEAHRLAKSSYRPFPNHRKPSQETAAIVEQIHERVKRYGQQVDLARQLGVTGPRLSDWLAGRRSMPMAMIEKAVEILGGRLTPARVEWEPVKVVLDFGKELPCPNCRSPRLEFYALTSEITPGHLSPIYLKCEGCQSEWKTGHGVFGKDSTGAYFIQNLVWPEPAPVELPHSITIIRRGEQIL